MRAKLRIEVEPIYISEVALDIMSKFDQLTLVRNHVRKTLAAHRQDVDGVKVSEASVEVGWLDGEIETLIFDLMVGFPTNTSRDWYAEWAAGNDGTKHNE